MSLEPALAAQEGTAQPGVTRDRPLHIPESPRDPFWPPYAHSKPKSGSWCACSSTVAANEKYL